MIRWHSKNNPRVHLSASEMLEISEEISQTHAPMVEAIESELVLLPVDPYHLYAYWNVDTLMAMSAEDDNLQKPLTLRIFWLPDQKVDANTSKLWFDLEVNELQTQQKIRLPIDESKYSAALGRRRQDNSFVAFVNSNTIQVPRGKMAVINLKPEQNTAENKLETVLPSPQADNDQLIEPGLDETVIDAKIKQTLQEKGIEVTQISANAADQVQGEKIDYFDETLIDTRINETLFSKGITEAISLPCDTATASELTHKSVSGKGIIH